jgi:hypothetical protein
MKHLPQKLIAFLANPTAEGSGLHRWLYHAACRLAGAGCDEQAIVTHLTESTVGTSRDLTREIKDATRGALKLDPNAPRSHKWPARKDAAIAEILKAGINEAKLTASSPDQFTGNAGEMLALLFPHDPLLCIGFHIDEFYTEKRSQWDFRWRRPQFIVPSPMVAKTGRTQSGKVSAKTNDNTGDRRFLVVEFDFVPAEKPDDALLLAWGERFGIETTRDMCAALANQLASKAPLALVVWSGNRSLHCWFPVNGVEEAAVRAFFSLACELGADPATWTPSQFVRIPCGWNRKKGQCQGVIYFNPSVLPV